MEMVLGWLAILVTLAMLPATALHLLASRHSPDAGSWMAAASLAMIVVLTVLAWVPRPGISAPWVTTSRNNQVLKSRIAPVLPIGMQREEKAAATSDPFLSLLRVRELWQRVTMRLALTPSPQMRWARIASFVALSGMGVGLIRLLLGLCAVMECRRRGNPIVDEDAIVMLEFLKRSMNFVAAVELRESSDLAMPFTAGWRRPMILLPVDWRSWIAGDLRAVLAHELAHIKRSDFIVGLTARLALSLHFYHPLVRWMTRRLLAQQELAADAVGARFSGGRGPYLAALSRMALRQDSVITWWPARAFSPARGTLIRRISMLRNDDVLPDLGWAPANRRLAAFVLASIAVSLWLVPAPGQVGDVPTKPIAQNATTPSHARSTDPPAFDLSYIPHDAMGVLAVHPAAMFRRKGMGVYAGQLSAWTALGGLEMGLEIPISKCPLKIEQIEQLSAGITFDRTVQRGKEMRRIIVYAFMIRSVSPFDWVKLIRSSWPNAVEQQAGNRVYYSVKDRKLDTNGIFHAPDNRTLVFGQERCLLRLLRRNAPVAPVFTRGDDWKKVEHDLFAVVMDNHGDRIGEATRSSVREDGEDRFSQLLESTDHWIMGLADADEFVLRFLADCHNSRDTQIVSRLVANLRDSWLKDLQKPHINSNIEHIQMCNYFKACLKQFQVENAQTSVKVELGGDVKLADLLPLIAKNGL
jgi:beta-lactamase regulating signal transducer with metallopeptidase domain